MIPLAEQAVQLLLKYHLTFAAAESCTGGGIAHAITGIPGASAAFMGGIVAYDNRIKQVLLNVSGETLCLHGAVSPECATEMVSGVQKTFKTDAAVSVTGIAGPGGGTPEKPVGLVYISAVLHQKIITTRNLFSGDRESIRAASIETALNMICGLIREEYSK